MKLHVNFLFGALVLAVNGQKVLGEDVTITPDSGDTPVDLSDSDTPDGLEEGSNNLSDSSPLEEEVKEEGSSIIVSEEEDTETESGGNRQINCLFILNNGCTRWEWFTRWMVKQQKRVCYPSSNFGPIISKCSSPGNYMFNRGMTFHSVVGGTVKSICRGAILDKTSSSVTTKHRFKNKCQFNGVKDIETFTIHYTNVYVGKRKGEPVSASEHFGKATECGKCEKKGDNNQHVTVMVKIGKTFVNPMGLFPALRSSHEIKGQMGEKGNYKFRVRTHCMDMTANRYHVRCNGKGYALDLNHRYGFPDKDIGKKPHKRDMLRPYLSPEKKIFEGYAWSTNLVVPKSFHNGGCCSVESYDVWGRKKAQGSYCQKKGLRA